MNFENARAQLLGEQPAFAAAPLQKKRFAERYVDSVLGALDAAAREPDDREASHLMEAIGHIFIGLYTAAVHTADKATVATEARAQGERGPRTSDTPTIADLRHFLDVARMSDLRVR